MFTGIIHGTAPIVALEQREGLTTFTLDLTELGDLSTLQIGASIALDGACLTVVAFDGPLVTFDAMAETLRLTTLGALKRGERVNVERAATFGQEIGGHLLSGHITAVATIVAIDTPANNHVITFKLDPPWIKYVLHKGYIGLAGASLTIADPDPDAHTFCVHLIPETLRRTSFGWLTVGDRVNVDLDQQTVAIVNTVERYLAHNRI
jgi:riboflavin synthase